MSEGGQPRRGVVESDSGARDVVSGPGSLRGSGRDAEKVVVDRGGEVGGEGLVGGSGSVEVGGEGRRGRGEREGGREGRGEGLPVVEAGGGGGESDGPLEVRLPDDVGEGPAEEVGGGVAESEGGGGRDVGYGEGGRDGDD